MKNRQNFVPKDVKYVILIRKILPSESLFQFYTVNSDVVLCMWTLVIPSPMNVSKLPTLWVWVQCYLQHTTPCPLPPTHLPDMTQSPLSHTHVIIVILCGSCFGNKTKNNTKYFEDTPTLAIHKLLRWPLCNLTVTVV